MSDLQSFTAELSKAQSCHEVIAVVIRGGLDLLGVSGAGVWLLGGQGLQLQLQVGLEGWAASIDGVTLDRVPKSIDGVGVVAIPLLGVVTLGVLVARVPCGADSGLQLNIGALIGQALQRAREHDVLAEECARLRAVLLQMPYAVSVVDPEGKPLISNARSQSIFRVPPGPTMRTVADFGRFKGFRRDGTELRAEDWPLARALLQGEVVRGEEVEIARGDGTRGFIRITATPVRNDGGSTIAGVVLFDDVSEELRVRQEAQNLQKQLQLITDAIPALVSFVDVDERYLFVNRAYETWFGRPREEILGKRIDEVLGLDVYLVLRPSLKRVMEGEPVTFEGDVPYRSGGNKFIRASYAPQFDEHKKVTGCVAVVLDLTETRRNQERTRFISEATLLLSSSLDYQKTLEKLAQILVPNLADWCGIDIVQEDGSLAQLAVAHVDPEKVELARELHKRYPPSPDAPAGAPNVIRTMKSELYSEISDELLVAGSRDAEHLRISRALGLRSAICVPIVVQGRGVGAISLVAAESGRRYDDIDVQLLEQLANRAAIAVENARLYTHAQDAIAHRDRFLSVASHELRTPLTVLTLQLEGLLRSIERRPDEALKSGKLESSGKSALSQTRRLTQLVETLLDVSRMREGRLQLEREAAVDLGALMSEAVERIRMSAEDVGCEIALHTDGDVSGYWDRLRLSQIATNLLTNAIKYGAGHPIDIRVKGGADRVLLSVRDHGIGISPEDKERIFGRFERAASIQFGGLGLGLWITRELVEAHGGKITVESKLDHGATFTVEIPRSL